MYGVGGFMSQGPPTGRLVISLVVPALFSESPKTKKSLVKSVVRVLKLDYGGYDPIPIRRTLHGDITR